MDDDDDTNHNHSPLYDRNPSPSCYFILQDPTLIDDPTSNINIHQDQNQDIHIQRDHRLPQWTQAETKLFLSVRAGLDRSFAETKRNKPLWEAVSLQMHQQGYARTPEQCKSKWKNLVTRYKGSEAMEGAAERQFPFREEMRSIFEDRAERSVSCKKGKEEEGEEEVACNKIKQKRRKKKGGEIEEAIREFGRKQMELEARWIEAAEAREAERRWKEEEWRREMAALAEERMDMERRWREKEEERRAREEARDERRHAIITAILTKISEKDEGF